MTDFRIGDHVVATEDLTRLMLMEDDDNGVLIEKGTPGIVIEDDNYYTKGVRFFREVLGEVEWGVNNSWIERDPEYIVIKRSELVRLRDSVMFINDNHYNLSAPHMETICHEMLDLLDDVIGVE